MKHDVEYELIDVDEQSTMFRAKCLRCGMKCKPLMHKADIAAALEEASCPGERKPTPVELDGLKQRIRSC